MPTPDHVVKALDALSTHAVGYDEAEAYYENTKGEVITSRRLQLLFGTQSLSQFRIGYARTPVDVLAERTEINGIECSDPGAQKLLDIVWEANQLGLEAKDIHKTAYEFGDAYLIGWPDDTLEGGVSLYAHDPRNVRVFYDPQRPREKHHAVHQWLEQGDAENGFGEGLFRRVNIYYPDEVEQYVSRNRVDAVQGQTTDVIGSDPDLVLLEGDLGVVANPTPGIIPVFHFRTARPYGRPEHADAYGPQNMLTKLATTMMVAVDYAGYPQRYVTTDSALEPTSPMDAFTPPPDDSFSTESGVGIDEQSDMQAGPGSTWLLSGSKVSVGQFPAAETNNFLNAIHSIIKQMSAVTDVPIHYFDRSGQMPSGESFRQAEAPLNKKVEDRQALFGVTWHEVFEWCLAANGNASSDAQAVWAPPMVWSDKDSWETAKLELEAGVPLDMVLRERGFTEDVIAEITEANDEAPAAAPAPAPDETGNLAEGPEDTPLPGL